MGYKRAVFFICDKCGISKWFYGSDVNALSEEIGWSLDGNMVTCDECLPLSANGSVEIPSDSTGRGLGMGMV